MDAYLTAQQHKALMMKIEEYRLLERVKKEKAQGPLEVASVIVGFQIVGHRLVRAIELPAYRVTGAMEHLETKSEPEEPPSSGYLPKVEIIFLFSCAESRSTAQHVQP